MRILVVEDDFFQIKLLRFKLVKDGFQVDYATNGIEALEKLKNNQYDLILCDIMMPGMDGFLFIKKIKQHPKWKDIPLIFLTARTDEPSIVKGLELGAEDYLTKPFSPQELSVRIKKILDRKK